MAEVGSAFVSLMPSAKGFGPATEKQITPGVTAAGKSSGSKFGKAFGAFAAIGGGAALGSFLKGAISGASDLNEQTTKTAAIFGRGASAVERFASKGASALGQTKLEVLSASSTFGVFGKAAGLGGRDLAKFSTDFTSLSTDLASFNNTSPEQAVEAIGAALRGEAEPMRQFGVLLDDATLRNEALKLGLIKTTKEALTPQQKVLAAQSSIYKQTADAQGDFQRTSGGLANQQRILSASFSDLRSTIGTALLPVATKFVTFLNTSAMPAITGLVGGMQNGTGAGGRFADAIAPVGAALKGIDFGSIAAGLSSVDFSAFGKAVASIDFGALKDSLGSGVSDTVSVFGVAVGFAADHVDTLAKYLPLLIGAFIAFKAAQAASNVLALASLPLMVANTVATFASASANRALATQLAVLNGVQQVGIVTRVRSTVATVAGTAASLAAAAATKVMAAGQWLLNAALTANPIGLVIVALVALGIGLAIAWRKSSTFRAIVLSSFEAVRGVVSSVIGWFGKFVPQVFAFVVGAVKAYIGVYKAVILGAFAVVRGAISGIGKAWDAAVDAVAGFVSGTKKHVGIAIGIVKAIPGQAVSALGGLSSSLYNSGQELIQGLINGITAKLGALVAKMSEVASKVKGFLPGSPVKTGPLRSWNNGGAGKRLVGMLADGLSDTGPVDAAMHRLVSGATLPRSAGNYALAGVSGAGGPQSVRLVVDGHEFRGYVETVADGQVRGSRNNSDMRRRAGGLG